MGLDNHSLKAAACASAPAKTASCSHEQQSKVPTKLEYLKRFTQETMTEARAIAGDEHLCSWVRIRDQSHLIKYLMQSCSSQERLTLVQDIKLHTLPCIMSPGSTSSTFVDRLILLAVPLMSMTMAETRSPSSRTSCTDEQTHEGQEGLQEHCKHLHLLEAPDSNGAGVLLGISP